LFAASPAKKRDLTSESMAEISMQKLARSRAISDSWTSQPRNHSMDETQLTPEELIAGMNPDEICELLAEMDIETTRDQALALQEMLSQFGSLEAAMDAFGVNPLPERDAA
jgi:hypothetical protein